MISGKTGRKIAHLKPEKPFWNNNWNPRIKIIIRQKKIKIKLSYNLLYFKAVVPNLFEGMKYF